MTKRYQSGLVGIDVKPHHHRHIKPNRYQRAARRRWVIPTAVAITALTTTWALILLVAAR